MNVDLGGLVLLYLLAQAGKRRGGYGGHGHAPPHHEDPHTFTPDGGLRPVSYGAPASGWTPYKPLTAEVIARAEALLHDPTKTETIEPDPAHPGEVVRYLRTHDTHTGKTNVTAWRPTHSAPATTVRT